MAEETTIQFLDRREKELLAQIAALRGQLGPKEAELVQVQRAKAALTSSAPGLLSGTLPALNNPGVLTGYADAFEPFLGGSTEIGNANALWGGLAALARKSYAEMTIKELVVQCLLDAFPDGATAAEIRKFIRDGYAKEIEPSSLRPQMHRLRADGVLAHNDQTDIWNLDSTRRRLYTMYNHASSRAAMKELQDDTLADEARRTIAGGGVPTNEIPNDNGLYHGDGDPPAAGGSGMLTRRKFR